MGFYRESLEQSTSGRSFQSLDAQLEAIVQRSGIKEALCHVFLHHTSASLILCENADPDVRGDLESFAQSWVQDGNPMFRHRDEGEDDMSAHIRTVFTQNALSLVVRQGQLDLGTWQSLYLWEHRYSPHTRRLTVTVMGDS